MKADQGKDEPLCFKSKDSFEIILLERKEELLN